MIQPPASGSEGAFGRAQPTGLASGRIPGTAIEFTQGFEDFVDRYRLLQSGRRTHRGAGCDCRRVRRPGCQDGSLLSRGQSGVTYDVLWMFEDRAGMKKRVEVENVVVGGRRPHGILLFIDDKRQPRESIARRRPKPRLGG